MTSVRDSTTPTAPRGRGRAILFGAGFGASAVSVSAFVGALAAIAAVFLIAASTTWASTRNPSWSLTTNASLISA